MQNERIIGITTMTAKARITLIEDVRKILDKEYSRKLKDGDKIVFYQIESGEIVIRPA